MARYVIKTESTKSLKTVVTKFGSEIPVSNDRVRGVFTIKNYRKYSYSEEVDVEFKGEIHVRWNRKTDWYDSSICDKVVNKQKVSKVKLNRFLRKSLLNEVKTHLNYFDVCLRIYSDIKKVNWI